jgi:hypothetical protein
MAARNTSKLAPAASAGCGEGYFLNGELASPEAAQVLVDRGLPFGDYRVASDFLWNLQTVCETRLRPTIRFHTIH